MPAMGEVLDGGGGLGTENKRLRDSEEHPTLVESCTITGVTRCHRGNIDTHLIETASGRNYFESTNLLRLLFHNAVKFALSRGILQILVRPPNRTFWPRCSPLADTRNSPALSPCQFYHDKEPWSSAIYLSLPSSSSRY